jgi:nitrogen fixation protein FixH
MRVSNSKQYGKFILGVVTSFFCVIILAILILAMTGFIQF